MYSERNEQEIILNFFSSQTTGRLLDIGACNGVRGSNSLALLEKGWSGVLVEPSKQQFDQMVTSYTQRGLINQTTLINSAVVPDFFDDNANFYDTQCKHQFGHGLGSFNLEWVKQWVDHLNDKNPNNQYTIQTDSIKPIRCHEFFENYGNTFDFVTIDTELLNLEIAVDVPWRTMNNLRLVCIESDENTVLSRSRFVTLFEQIGFRLYDTDSSGMNLFFCRNK